MYRSNLRNPPNLRMASGPDYPEYWIDEYHFADDPFVTADMRDKGGAGSFSSILTLTRGADGVLRAVRDIKLSVVREIARGDESTKLLTNFARRRLQIKELFSVPPLCSLCLCGECFCIYSPPRHREHGVSQRH